MALYAVLLFSMLATSGDFREIPTFLRICHKSDSDLFACLKSSVEALRPHLRDGDPEYNIPSVEPIVINDLIKEESAGLKVETTNVVAHGGGDFVIRDIRADYDTLQFEVNILLPRLTIDAKYHLDGKIAMLPIRGQGDFFGNLTDCTGHCKMKGEIFMKDGAEHVRLTENIMKVTVGGGHVRLDNLFGGDKSINKLINDIINDNLDVFLNEFLPYIERGLAKNFMDSGNQFMSSYRKDQIFPD